jgi:hypothetical protein
MTAEPLEELYFQWLYRQVAPPRMKTPADSHWSLLLRMHNTEFTYFVPNDDNRAVDGQYLRYEFLDSLPPARQLADEDWMRIGCSMLEMLIALSRRLSFYTGGASSNWFWHLVDNIGLKDCNDARPCSEETIDRALRRVIDRTYDREGNGGLFPARGTKLDQRQVEIWDQMNHYLLERG